MFCTTINSLKNTRPLNGEETKIEDSIGIFDINYEHKKFKDCE